MNADRISGLIAYAFRVHSENAAKPSKAVRKWDGKTPYGIHPTWCAMTILAETTLPEELRYDGAEALLFHDILEDTTAALLPDTRAEVVDLVREMTFVSSDREMVEVWGRGPTVLLLKLYDKTSNLLDGVWMSPEKRGLYNAYLLRLCDEVEKEYVELNIIKIARAIAG